MIFIITWYAFANLKNNLFKLVGISAFFIGIIDLLHTLSYKGMNLFEGYDSDLPTQLWIVARFIQSIAFLIGIVLKKEIKNGNYLFSLFLGFSGVTIVLVFLRIFPVCYIENEGLTKFKIISEYFICGIILFSIILLCINQERYDHNVFMLIILAGLITILSEIFFTFYIGVYDISNVIGHFFKIIVFLVFYRVLLHYGLKEPQKTLYFELKKREMEVKQAGEEIKELQSLLPICAGCKKIRDDGGYWVQVEEYLNIHRNIQFSHGFCPDCLKKFYPNIDFK
jgi:hypothetical protein